MDTSSELRQLVKDAWWAIGISIAFNMLVLFFFIVDGIYNKFVLACLFLQAFLFITWLLPVFLYQVLYKKFRPKYAIYTALASYKEAFRYMTL